jgi:hypothetical protein
MDGLRLGHRLWFYVEGGRHFRHQHGVFGVETGLLAG